MPLPTHDQSVSTTERRIPHSIRLLEQLSTKLEFKGYHSGRKKMMSRFVYRKIQGNGGVQLLPRTCQPALRLFKCLELPSSCPLSSTSTTPGWLSQDELSLRQDVISPFVILPVHAFHSFSCQGTALLSSSTIELPSEIVKSGAYSPDIVRTIARLHELRRLTRLSTTATPASA